MQIETKFNVGGKHWFIDGQGQILEVIITVIDVKVRDKTVFEYHIMTTSTRHTFSCVKENQLYNTKQEAGEAWLKSQGLKCGVSDD